MDAMAPVVLVDNDMLCIFERENLVVDSMSPAIFQLIGQESCFFFVRTASSRETIMVLHIEKAGERAVEFSVKLGELQGIFVNECETEAFLVKETETVHFRHF
jgi:hypothetical protein